jgi:hypothetical protein
MKPVFRSLVPQILLAALVLQAAPLFAQQASDDLTLERIFASGDFASDRFGPARWLADGSGYTTVEPSSVVRGLDIVRYDPESAARTILVDARRLVPEGQSQPLILEDYEWSDDGTKLLVYTNTRRVWRVNSRGDYWVLDLDSGRLQQLGGGAEESTLMFAKFRLTHAHQRELRLGLRRGVRHSRRVPVEPGWGTHRVLAIRRQRSEGLRPHQQHRLPLPATHDDPLSEGG